MVALFHILIVIIIFCKLPGIIAHPCSSSLFQSSKIGTARLEVVRGWLDAGVLANVGVLIGIGVLVGVELAIIVSVGAFVSVGVAVGVDVAGVGVPTKATRAAARAVANS